MTGTLSYRPEETGGIQREKSLDTRHRRPGRPISRFTVARRLHGGGLFARRPVRCTFNACPSEKTFSVVPGTPELEAMNGDEYSLQMRADSVSVAILIAYSSGEAGKPQSSLEHH
ncbi:hypothetical protein TNCV_2574101 [Trichonephila clavipes]|nr:hypothetical protein TNCV_2574101 [Trichonephila clavipes]